MDQAEHAREQEMQQRVEDLEKNVDRLEQALKNGRAKAVFRRDIFRHPNCLLCKELSISKLVLSG